MGGWEHPLGDLQCCMLLTARTATTRPHPRPFPQKYSSDPESPPGSPSSLRTDATPTIRQAPSVPLRRTCTPIFGFGIVFGRVGVLCLLLGLLFASCHSGPSPCIPCLAVANTYSETEATKNFKVEIKKLCHMPDAGHCDAPATFPGRENRISGVV